MPDSSTVLGFESAAEAIVTGDVDALQWLLNQNPELIRTRSMRPHHATLLHYVAANGVEQERQKTPANAVRVADILLAAGAEVDAAADTYGGGPGQTTLNLLVSSVHPAKAGVQVALVHTLIDAGAAVNGVANDNSPLRTALSSGYSEAAEALASRGARIYGIEAAAGLGRVDLVEGFLDESTTAQRELALVWAAMHGRRQVVEFLLESGVEVAAQDQRHWTALHWAAQYGRLETVALLLKRSAPLDRANEFGGTPLNQTIWTSTHEGLSATHVQVVKMLMEAGAAVDAGWLQSGLQPPLPPPIAEVLRRAPSPSL